MIYSMIASKFDSEQNCFISQIRIRTHPKAKQSGSISKMRIRAHPKSQTQSNLHCPCNISFASSCHFESFAAKYVASQNTMTIKFSWTTDDMIACKFDSEQSGSISQISIQAHPKSKTQTFVFLQRALTPSSSDLSTARYFNRRNHYSASMARLH